MSTYLRYLGTASEILLVFLERWGKRVVVLGLNPSGRKAEGRSARTLFYPLFGKESVTLVPSWLKAQGVRRLRNTEPRRPRGRAGKSFLQVWEARGLLVHPIRKP